MGSIVSTSNPAPRPPPRGKYKQIPTPVSQMEIPCNCGRIDFAPAITFANDHNDGMGAEMEVSSHVDGECLNPVFIERSGLLRYAYNNQLFDWLCSYIEHSAPKNWCVSSSTSEEFRRMTLDLLRNLSIQRLEQYERNDDERMKYLACVIRSFQLL